MLVTTFTVSCSLRATVRSSNASGISSTSGQLPPQGLATVHLASLTKGQFQPTMVSRIDKVHSEAVNLIREQTLKLLL